MPLIKNGKPFNPFYDPKTKKDDEDMKKKFNKVMRFRVPLESIWYEFKENDRNGRPTTRQLTTIPVSYNHMDSETGRGRLIYFDNEKYDPDTKRTEYMPYFISIDKTGVLVTLEGNPELNWFLFNHPRNKSNVGSKNLLAEYRTSSPIFENVESAKEVNKYKDELKAMMKLGEYLGHEKGEKTWTWEQLLAACEAIVNDNTLRGVPPAIARYREYEKNNESLDIIRTALWNMAKENAVAVLGRIEHGIVRDFTFAVHQLMRADINDLYYSAESKEWKLRDGKKESVVCVVPDKVDPMDYLIKEGTDPSKDTGMYIMKKAVVVPIL